MSLAIMRDPAKRMGGSALITLPAGDSATASVVVTMDGGASTLGPHGWQGGGHVFGPYNVESGPRGQFIRVGPEIVNQMEAYDPVEISVPERSASVALSWPADILPSPDGASGGGVRVVGDSELAGKAASSKPPEPPPQPPPPPPPTVQEPPPAAPPKPKPEPGPEPKPEPKSNPEPPAPTPSNPKRSRSMLIVPIALALAAIIGAVIFFTSTETAPPAPAMPTADCTRDHLRTVLRDTEVTVATLRPLLTACQTANDRDLEVRVLDRLAALGDAKALNQFAEWYDPATAAGTSPFTADPELAARYYKRAIDAGSADAEAKMGQLCTTLRGRPDRPAKVIVEIYCQ